MDTETADSVIDAAIAGQATSQAALGPNQGKAQPEDDSLLPSYTPLDEQAPPPPPESADERKIREAQEELLGKEEAERLAKEEAERQAKEATLLGQANKLLNSGKQTASKTGNWLGNVPTPGDLTVPLIILGVLFLLLVTYNGQTRFQWLWLVLTGNANVVTTLPGTGEGPPAKTKTPPAGQSSGKGPPPPAFQFDALALPAFSINGTYGSESFL